MYLWRNFMKLLQIFILDRYRLRVIPQPLWRQLAFHRDRNLRLGSIYEILTINFVINSLLKNFSVLRYPPLNFLRLLGLNRSVNFRDEGNIRSEIVSIYPLGARAATKPGA